MSANPLDRMGLEPESIAGDIVRIKLYPSAPPRSPWPLLAIIGVLIAIAALAW